MTLRAGFLALAFKLQEASQAMSTDDVRTRLSDCLNDTFRGTGNWGYVVAVFGDDKSGDVVYSCNSDLKKAPYKIGKSGTAIDTTASVDVQPLTTYESETQVLEAGRRNSSRDLRQLQAIHDSSVGLGAACAAARESAGHPGVTLHKSVDTAGNGSTRGVQVGGNPPTGHESAPLANGSGGVLGESQTLQTDSNLKLVESSIFSQDIPLQEAFKMGYQIKLIAPGKGSSAFYPAEVLKRDGPKVFKAGTPMRINHPTAAEEAARPEGDVHNWGAVLSKDAYWLDDHKQGPGLYSEVKPFSDHVQTIHEKGPYAGVSICARGNAVMESGRPALRDGLPVLASLEAADGVDMVTRAGAGGMFLQESARVDNSIQEAAMDAAELTKLQESVAAANAAATAANAANAKLLERSLRGDAREEAGRILSGVTLPEASKLRVIDNVLREALPKTEAGELDTVKFAEAVNAEAKREGSYVAGLIGSGNVTGMGSVGEATPAREAEKPEEINARAIKIFERLGHSKEAAQMAVKGRVA